MCQVTTKSSDLTPPPPPPRPPPPSPKLLKTKAEPQLRTYAPPPPPPPSSKLINTTRAQSKSPLNPYAEPFSPLTNSPFNALCLHAPAMTRPFSFHPMIYFYFPTTPVSSSYPPRSQGNNRCNAEEHGVLLNGEKKKKKKRVVGRVKRQIGETKEADSNKKGDDIDYQVMFAGGNTTLMIKNIPNRLK